jgi:hypothetical protein
VTESAYPSVTDIDAVASIAEPIFRNLRITAAYAQLSGAFARWLPGGANWCTFATWASLQAGTTIRKEDLARAVAARARQRLQRRPILRRAHRLFGVPVERFSALVGEVSQGLPGIDRASDSVAVGNRKVFEEIGREFARFLGEPGASMESFTRGLRNGPPPDGQELLRRAFANYQAARDANDATVRAQLLLLANVQIGLHEQTRLQPEIRGAMDAALLDVADTRRRILDRVTEVIEAGPLGLVHSGKGRLLLNAVADEISEELRLVARIVITEHLMSIGLSQDRTLRLGADAVTSFPSVLSILTNPDLVSLLREFDATPDTPGGSAAVDWSVLPQRLRFIADFFRGYQLDPTLFDSPFDPTQLQAIADERVPDRV